MNTELKNKELNSKDGKPPVVCITCGSGCDKTGFSPQGSNDWFCSQECYDDYQDDDDFQCCADCDLPDACSDFGCAIKSGIVKRRYW